MKKFLRLAAYVFLSVSLIFSGGITNVVQASQIKQVKDRSEIAPYQKVISKLNKELSANINIPDDKALATYGFDVEKVYNNIINIPIDQFENNLRKDYLEAKNNSADGKSNLTIKIDKNSVNNIDISAERTTNLSQNVIVSPYSVTEPGFQICYLANNYGAVTMTSELWSATGAIGTYRYNKIINFGYNTYTDRTHFRASSYTYTLSSDSKICSAKYIGSLFTGAGIDLCVYYTVNVDYNANA